SSDGDVEHRTRCPGMAARRLEIRAAIDVGLDDDGAIERLAKKVAERYVPPAQVFRPHDVAGRADDGRDRDADAIDIAALDAPFRQHGADDLDEGLRRHAVRPARTVRMPPGAAAVAQRQAEMRSAEIDREPHLTPAAETPSMKWRWKA